MKYQKNSLFSGLFLALIAMQCAVKPMEITEIPAEAWYGFAKFYEQNNNTERAVECLEISAELDYPKGLFALGKYYLGDTSTYSQGLGNIRKAITQDASLSGRAVDISTRRTIDTQRDLAKILLECSDEKVKKDGVQITENILKKVLENNKLHKNTMRQSVLSKVYNSPCYAQAKEILGHTDSFKEYAGLLEYRAFCSNITHDAHTAINYLSPIGNSRAYSCLADLFLRDHDHKMAYEYCKKILEDPKKNEYEQIARHHLKTLEERGWVEARIYLLGQYAQIKDKTKDDHAAIKILLKKLTVADGQLLRENDKAYRVLKKYAYESTAPVLQKYFAQYVMNGIDDRWEQQEAISQLEKLAQRRDNEASFLLIKKYLNDSKMLASATRLILNNEIPEHSQKEFETLFRGKFQDFLALAKEGDPCVSWLCGYGYCHEFGQLKSAESTTKALDYFARSCLQQDCPLEIFESCLGYLQRMAIGIEKSCDEHSIRAWGYLCGIYIHTDAPSYLIEESCNKINELILSNQKDKAIALHFLMILKEIKVFDALKKNISGKSPNSAVLLARCYALSAAIKKSVIDGDNNTVLEQLLHSEEYLAEAQHLGADVADIMRRTKSLIGIEYQKLKRYDKAIEYFKQGSEEVFLNLAKIYIEHKNNLKDGASWLKKAMENEKPEAAVLYANFMATPKLAEHGVTKELLTKYADIISNFVTKEEISILDKCGFECPVEALAQIKEDDKVDVTNPSIIYLQGVDAFYHDNYSDALAYFKQVEESIFLAKGYKALILRKSDATVNESLEVATEFLQGCSNHSIVSAQFFLQKSVWIMINRMAHDGNISAQCVFIKESVNQYLSPAIKDDKHKHGKLIDDWLISFKEKLDSLSLQEFGSTQETLRKQKVYLSLKKFFQSSRSCSWVNLLMEIIKKNLNIFDMPDSCYIEDIISYYTGVKDKKEEHNRIGEFLSGLYTKKARDAANLKNMANSRTLYEKALEYDKNNQEAHIALGMLLFGTESDQDSTKKALNHFHEAADVGNNAIAQGYLGHIYCGLYDLNIKKDVDKGLSYMEKVAKAGQGVVYVTIASLYLVEKNNRKKAEEYLKLAEENDCALEAKFYRGHIAYTEKKYKDAKEHFSDLLSTDDSRVMCYLLLIELEQSSKVSDNVTQLLKNIVDKMRTDEVAIKSVLSLEVVQKLTKFISSDPKNQFNIYYKQMGEIIIEDWRMHKTAYLDKLEEMLKKFKVTDESCIAEIEQFIIDKKIAEDAKGGDGRAAYCMAYFALKKRNLNTQQAETDEDIEQWLNTAKSDKGYRARASMLLLSRYLVKVEEEVNIIDKIKLLTHGACLIIDTVAQKDLTVSQRIYEDLKHKIATVKESMVTIQNNLEDAEKIKMIGSFIEKLNECEEKIDGFLSQVAQQSLSDNNK